MHLMLVRICLLVMLAVALATGCTAAGDGLSNLQAEVVELGAEDAMEATAAELSAPVVSPAPPLVRGTEGVHTSPVSARVFRPPRVTSG